jgi:osmotically-inducible protein OsmY
MAPWPLVHPVGMGCRKVEKLRQIRAVLTVIASKCSMPRRCEVLGCKAGREAFPRKQKDLTHSGGSMITDSDIKQDVEDELRWTPDVDPTDIGVAVKDGVVTLSGFVKSYSEKIEAEKAVKRVAGVRGVANDLEVRLLDIDQRPDPDIARDAVAALKSQLPFSSQFIKVVVDHGWVMLEGDVEWNYARKSAEKAVRRIKGVSGVSNLIKLKPKADPSEIKRKIEDAFRRSAEVDASNIQVEADGGTVTLRGTVKAWAEREAAERAAWRAPGVMHVDNRIVVSP